MRRRRRPKPLLVRQMLRDRRKRPQYDEMFTLVVIVPAESDTAIGPFTYPHEADAHAKAIQLEDYTLMTVVPPRARLRVV